MTVLLWLGDASLWAAGFAGLFFLSSYSVVARWWHRAEGWLIAVLTFGLTLIMSYFAWTTVLRKSPANLLANEGQLWARFGVALFILGIFIWAHALMVTRQVQGLRRRRRNAA